MSATAQVAGPPTGEGDQWQLLFNTLYRLERAARLTAEKRLLVAGEGGPSAAMAMRVPVDAAKLMGADEPIEIRTVDFLPV